MARKKQEIALQVEVETQEEWEEMLSKEGLTGQLNTDRYLFINKLNMIKVTINFFFIFYYISLGCRHPNTNKM